MPLPLLIEFLLCPLVLASLLWVTAPYGRHYRKGWGPTLPNRAAWIAMELPALLVVAVLTLSSPYGRQAVAWVPLLFWCGHYGYRTFIFPMLMRPSNQTFPGQLVLFAVIFNVLNGYNNSMALQSNAADGEPLLTPHFLLGAAVFLSGFVMHVHSDAIIRNLRQPGDSGYHIPQGGFFRWVGSPNYLGEMIMWSGWAIMTWSLAGLAFALFTICNLAPRAISNHRWYRETFPDYPSGRKILIPGIF